jgi:hypothetical protein
MYLDSYSDLRQVKVEFQPPKAHLIPILEWVGLPGRELLLIDVGMVGAVQVLDENLRALEKGAGVLPGNPFLAPTVIGQVNVGEDAVDRILPANDDLAHVGRERQYGI